MCTNTHHTIVTIPKLYTLLILHHIIHHSIITIPKLYTPPHYTSHRVTPHLNSMPYSPHSTSHATYTPLQSSNNFYTIFYSYKYCIKQSWCKQYQMGKKCTSRREYSFLVKQSGLFGWNHITSL
jgi:hypothetical protein